MNVLIRGRRWRIERCELSRRTAGECDAPDAESKAIRIDRRLKGQEELETIIHEVIHAAHWDLCEEAVDETAEAIARVLWRLGYRQRSDDAS